MKNPVFNFACQAPGSCAGLQMPELRNAVEAYAEQLSMLRLADFLMQLRKVESNRAYEPNSISQTVFCTDCFVQIDGRASEQFGLVEHCLFR